MFLASRSNSGMPYHTSPSGGNCCIILIDSCKLHQTKVEYHVNYEDFWSIWTIAGSFDDVIVGGQYAGSNKLKSNR